MLTRRFMITAAFLAPFAAFAHDGHDLSRIGVTVAGIGPVLEGLQVSLQIENHADHDIALAGIYSDLGDVGFAPVSLAPGQKAEVQALIHSRDWPGIFTLILDFGEAGLGPVTVIPT